MKSMETGRQDGGSDKNHAPFSVGKTGNISRKFLTIILKIFDKNFERLHKDPVIVAEQDLMEQYKTKIPVQSDKRADDHHKERRKCG